MYGYKRRIVFRIQQMIKVALTTIMVIQFLVYKIKKV